MFEFYKVTTGRVLKHIEKGETYLHPPVVVSKKGSIPKYVGSSKSSLVQYEGVKLETFGYVHSSRYARVLFLNDMSLTFK